MQIRLTKYAAGPDFVLAPGAIADMDDQVAQLLIDAGSAVRMRSPAETALAPAVETALAPAAETALAPAAETALAPAVETAEETQDVASPRRKRTTRKKRSK